MQMTSLFKTRILGTALLLATSGVAAAQQPGGGFSPAKRVELPPPMHLLIPAAQAWDSLKETLSEDIKAEVSEENPFTGIIVTRYTDYIDGPLTRDHIAKIGVPIKLASANWIRARYRYRIVMELIAERRTLLTVDAEVQGLKRELLGEESWVDIRSNGRLERDLLTAFGTRLFGSDFSLARPKKGFWEHAPGHVSRPENSVPTVARPERPPS